MSHDLALARALSYLPGEYFFSSFDLYKKLNLTSIQALAEALIKDSERQKSFEPMLKALPRILS